MTKQWIAIPMLLLVATSVMCAASQRKEPLESEPDFVGFITAIGATGTGNTIAVIQVESHAGKMVRRHRVAVTRDTLLLRREGDATRAIQLAALQNKDWVRLWFDGAGAPLDVTARQLVVVDRP